MVHLKYYLKIELERPSAYLSPGFDKVFLKGENLGPKSGSKML